MTNLLRLPLLSGAALLSLMLPVVAQADTMPQATSTPAAYMQHHAGYGMHGGMRGHHKMMMHEFKRLKLSDAQWTKIRELDKSFRESHDKSAGKQPPDRREIKAHEEAVMAVLTPAQRDQFKKDMAERRAMHAERMRTRMSSPMPNAQMTGPMQTPAPMTR